MPTAMARTPWVVRPVPNPAARLRLLCFPYAGAGASVFSVWPHALPPEVELCAVQMPGREARLNEPPMTRWSEVVEDLAEAVVPWTDRPYALFGHSLGAVQAFELARRLRRDRRPGPVHLFVSGRRAPHLPLDEPPTHHLPDDEFVQELRRLTGTPEDVLQNREMLEIFIPLLRADFGLAEMHAYQEDEPLTMPISAYGGMNDEFVSPAKLDAWREHTTSTFRRVMFPGGHFFLNENRAALLVELSHELRKIAGVARA